MAKGDQKRRVMEKHQLDEPSYYAFSSRVGQQRHFNVLTAKLLALYGFDPLSFLESQGQAMPNTYGQGNYVKWLTEECDDAMTLLRAYLEYGGDGGCGDEYSVAGRIADRLTPTTEASLRRWGDPNHFTPRLLKAYTAPDGIPLDEQALMISDDCFHVEICELVDFIVAHPKGQLSYRPRRSTAQLIADRFELIAGFKLSGFYAETLNNLISKRYQDAPAVENMPF